MFKKITLGFCCLCLGGLTGCGPPVKPNAHLFVLQADGSKPREAELDPYVCAGDTRTADWVLYGVSQGTLSATPPEATAPALTARRVTKSGQLDLKILADVKLTLQIAGDTDERFISMVPEDFCTGFVAPPLGNFSGKLTQTSPGSQTLERDLSLWWDGKSLRGELRTPGSSYTQVLALTCTVDTGANTVRCADAAERPSFEFVAAVTVEGLAGTYQGSQEGSTYNGTLEFARTTEQGSD